jgi:hypothetical protein
MHGRSSLKKRSRRWQEIPEIRPGADRHFRPVSIEVRTTSSSDDCPVIETSSKQQVRLSLQ